MWASESKRKAELPSDWAARRRRVIARDKGVCVLCGAPGTDVDHIDRFGPHDLWNLRLLCHPCHMRRTGRDGGLAVRRPHMKRKWDKWKPRGNKHPGLK